MMVEQFHFQDNVLLYFSLAKSVGEELSGWEMMCDFCDYENLVS